MERLVRVDEDILCKATITFTTDFDRTSRKVEGVTPYQLVTCTTSSNPSITLVLKALELKLKRDIYKVSRTIEQNSAKLSIDNEVS